MTPQDEPRVLGLPASRPGLRPGRDANIPASPAVVLAAISLPDLGWAAGLAAQGVRQGRAGYRGDIDWRCRVPEFLALGPRSSRVMISAPRPSSAADTVNAMV